MYKASSSQGPAAGGVPEQGGAGPAAEAKKEGEVIDAEYVDVEDKK